MGGKEGGTERGREEKWKEGEEKRREGRDEFITYFLRLLYKFYDVSVLAIFFSFLLQNLNIVVDELPRKYA